MHFYKKDLKDVIGRIEACQAENVIEKCYFYVLLKVLHSLENMSQKDVENFRPEVIELTKEDIPELPNSLYFEYNINFSSGEYWIHIRQF